MPAAAVRPHVHQPLDVHGDFGAQRALDLVVPLDDLPQARACRVAQVPRAHVRADPRLRENLSRVTRADAENVRQGILDLLVARQVHASDAGHRLPLPLLVFGIPLTDDPDHAPALDHLAVLADGFDAGTYLQRALAGREKNPIES